ncbi:MAG: ankyrin repeat domain-containing protein [Candidatus Thorarchaeota archaeon]
MSDVDKVLLKAAEEGDLEIVKKALDSGADIKARDEFFKNTALHLACDNGHLDIVEFLMGIDSDITVMNGTDMTPLHMAVRSGHTDIVKYICDMNLPITERILNDVLTVAGMSVYSNDIIYKMVYDYRLRIVRPAPKKAGNSNELLLLSSESGDYEGVVKALSKGADPNTVDDRGMLPILWAALRGHFDIVKHLVENGADIDGKNHADWTALMQASMEGHLDIVKYLVEKGAEVNARTFVSGTALMFSSGNGHIEVVKFLLANGADITIQIDGTEDDDGMTALDYAIQYGRPEVAKILREHTT